MPYPIEVEQAIKKLLAKEVPASQSHHLCSFAVVDNDEAHCWWNSNCLNSLRGGAQFIDPIHLILLTKDKYLYADSYNEPIGGGHKHFKLYVDWLINKSLFSSCFISKDVEQILSDGCVVIGCDVPASLMMCAASAFRYTWEFPWLLDNWAELVRLGVNKGQAFVLAHLYHKPYGKDGYTKGVGTHNSNHIIINRDHGLSLLDTFTTNNLDELLLDGTFRYEGRYNYVQKTFYRSAKGALGNVLDEVELDTIEVEGGLGTVKISVIAGDNPHATVIEAFHPYLEINNG